MPGHHVHAQAAHVFYHHEARACRNDAPNVTRACKASMSAPRTGQRQCSPTYYTRYKNRQPLDLFEVLPLRGPGTDRSLHYVRQPSCIPLQGNRVGAGILDVILRPDCSGART